MVLMFNFCILTSKPLYKGIKMIGFKNEILEVIEYVGKKYKNCNLWKCICKCGKEIFRLTTEIKRKKPVSCGCWKNNKPSNNNKIKLINLDHGLSSHILYKRWKNIKQRCYNKRHPFYKYYGLKGIEMCDLWKNNFKNFYDWCISQNWKKELVIDRINNNLHYEPDNCQLISNSENTKKANINNVYFNKNNRTVAS